MSQSTLGASPYHNSSLFSGYYLDERIDDLEEWECDEAAQAAFEELQQLWELEGNLVSGYKEDELLNSWIDEVIDILGFGSQSETTVPGGGGYNDRLLFTSEEARREAATQALDGGEEVMYGRSIAVLEAKQWDADFNAKFDEQRSYRDASHQIKYYLERTPEQLQWGILTDGKKWRLYGTKDYATEVYYEVDLPELLETGNLEKFKYFYAFFRPEAFREVAGTTFLDTVWNESETAAQELGEDLQDNVFTALRVLGEGFIHSNDLDIDPDDEDARETLKEQSLVLLYRLMFVLYAESRGLIHPEDPKAQAEYEEHFSLDQLRLEIHEAITSGDTYDDFSGYATQMWGQLQDLFGLVDAGKEELGIPPYNGGLFDEEQHAFLAEHEVADRYIAEVIHRLGTTEDEAGDPVLADYADLDTRHLGSIYEGLLEHEFRIASEPYAAVAEDGGQVWKPGTEVSVAEAVETVEEGELYVVNDDGERKATGAYYTPDYVVSYIVEETVDPLLDDIRAELEAEGLEPADPAYFGRFYSEVLDLKILDPAMGSAHFLTNATGYLTEQVMEIVREQERQGRDEQELRRTIAKECIYGVDVNGMAVELGKLSMWLETLAADRPLAFLDHHLKIGNSLVGSDISEVLSDDTEENGGQLTLTQAFGRARQQTLEHVMDLMEELLAIDNVDLADIKSMKKIYDEIRADPLYQRLFEIANVNTAEEFGLDVPEGVYEKMAGAVENEQEWEEIQQEDWFQSAQAMADEEDFFHWELEYPEVFFGSNGERLDGAGFDAVVGNPPYVLIEGQIEQYLRDTYESPQYFVDLFHVFIEKGIDICRTGGGFGYIIPEPWLTQENTESLRSVVLRDSAIRRVTRFDSKVFADATVDTITLHLEKDSPGEVEIAQGHNESGGDMDVEVINTVPQSVFSDQDSKRIEVRQTAEEQRLLRRMTNTFASIDDVAEVSIGIQAYNSTKHSEETIESQAFHADHKVSEEYLPEVSGQDVSRYRIQHDGETWVKYGSHLHDYRPMRFFSEPRILVREITGSGRYKIHAAYTDAEICNYKTVLNILPENGYSPFYILGVLNSALMSWVFPRTSNKVVSDTFPRISVADIESLPIPAIKPSSDSESRELSLEQDPTTADLRPQSLNSDGERAALIAKLAEENTNLVNQLSELNLSLRDHLGSYSDGQTLADIGLTQPPQGAADSILHETTEQKPNLRVGEASVSRKSVSTVEIRLTARYKPDPSEKGADAYTETEPLPALRITDLSETEADLIEAFVPVAVDEADGFADFRENATKTNSLIDRLRQLTLPAVDDVRDELENYFETKERAENLEAKIDRANDLIDGSVYELYGLTDEEIKLIEETVEV